MAFQFQSAMDELFKPPSRLQTLIDRAVRPELREPDIVLNLDICDLINKKKGNYAHDAAFALLPYINGRSNSQAQLALGLLDYLVKNCGHAVHYQVASRDFLNDLFRRFPEFQPSQPNALHYRILEMLQEWRLTLCKRSRYKDDLQRIHDMYSLLRRKGWRFPEIDANAAAVVLGPVNTLKSRDEQEREDLEAMQAKLQELLRRATPKDLREANKLMKIITGYEQSSKRPDYDGEWEGKLKEIEVNVKVLLEMLQRVQPGDRLSETVNELKAAVGSNQPRLRKLIAEMQQRPDGEELPEDEARDLARLASISALVDEALSAHRNLQCGRAPVFSLSATASAAPEGELIVWDDAPDTPATGDASAPRPSAPPKDATALAARHRRCEYDAERRSEMGAAERRATQLLAMLGTAVPGEQMPAEIRRTRAECMASLALLQELAQEQKRHARLSEDEKHALAAMCMVRDRIQAALGAYEELKSGRRPQIAGAGAAGAAGAAVPAKKYAVGELLAWDEGVPGGAAGAGQITSPLGDLAGLSFSDASFSANSHALALPLTPGMNTPGLSMPVGNTATCSPASAATASAICQQQQPMSNPSLPANSLQARTGKPAAAAAAAAKKDAFDFSDLLSAAKSASAAANATAGARPNASRTTSWGSSPDPDKAASGSSLIDFMS